MSVGTLYSSCKAGENTRTRAILPNGLIKFYNLDVKISDPDEHFPSEFVSGSIPAFRYPCGRTLTESIPVVLKLASLVPEQANANTNIKLLGDNSAADQARILAWMNIFNLELLDNVIVGMKMHLKVAPYDADFYDMSVAIADRQLHIINEHLTKNTYLVGEHVTIADLYCATMCYRGFNLMWDNEYRAKFPAFCRWFETVKRSPVLCGFFDDVKYVEKFTRPQ